MDKIWELLLLPFRCLARLCLAVWSHIPTSLGELVALLALSGKEIACMAWEFVRMGLAPGLSILVLFFPVLLYIDYSANYFARSRAERQCVKIRGANTELVDENPFPGMAIESVGLIWHCIKASLEIVMKLVGPIFPYMGQQLARICCKVLPETVVEFAGLMWSGSKAFLGMVMKFLGLIWSCLGMVMEFVGLILSYMGQQLAWICSKVLPEAVVESTGSMWLYTKQQLEWAYAGLSQISLGCPEVVAILLVVSLFAFAIKTAWSCIEERFRHWSWGSALVLPYIPIRICASLTFFAFFDRYVLYSSSPDIFSACMALVLLAEGVTLSGKVRMSSKRWFLLQAVYVACVLILTGFFISDLHRKGLSSEEPWFSLKKPFPPIKIKDSGGEIGYIGECVLKVR